MIDNPFYHPDFTPDEIERAMPLNDRVATLQCLCSAEICGWHGRVIAARIIKEATKQMEARQ